MEKIRKTKLVLVAMIVFIVFVTIFSTVFAFQFFKHQKITALGEHATSFAVALGTKDISNLTGEDSDLNNESYISLKEKLIRLRQFNSDVRFTYLMGERNDNIFFYADSEKPESPDYSPPGQIYTEASPILYKVFSTGTIQTEVSSDRWGKWLSVMAPVIDYKNHNQVVAMVGFDIAYNVYLEEIILFSLLPVSVGVIILILLIATLMYTKKNEEWMKIRSEYFAIAAHDLRTPLTGIKFAMSSLKKSIPADSRKGQSNILDQISQSTENMLSSVNELLDSSSIEKTSGPKLQLNKINIVEILKNNVSALAISAKEKNIQVTCTAPVELLINGDSDKLHRVFANLLSNSIKYSKDNGTVKVTAKKSGENITVSFKDSGIGIPVNEQEKIFNGYFRASNAKNFTQQGTGLGLYYVKNIVELHGGSIKLNSVPNKGTELILTFKQAQQEYSN